MIGAIFAINIYYQFTACNNHAISCEENYYDSIRP
jgi:hypothetical protein